MKFKVLFKIIERYIRFRRFSHISQLKQKMDGEYRKISIRKGMQTVGKKYMVKKNIKGKAFFTDRG